MDRLVSIPDWPARYDGSHRDLAALKNLTSQLIGRFARAAQDATTEAYGDAPLSRYAAALAVPAGVRAEVEVLKAVADRYVMSRDEAARRYELQTELVHELVDLLSTTAPVSLDPIQRDAWADAPDDAARLRVVLDQVASLTDASAVSLRRRLAPGSRRGEDDRHG
jgi:dGTPase